jgi:ABC-2 type transport system permease protein
MNTKHIWYIAVKNVRLFLTDRLAMGMFILFPFLFIVMFNLLLGNVNASDPRLQLHLVSLESYGLSQHIIQSLVTVDETKLKPGDPKIIWDQDYNQAKADVQSGKIDGFLAFPADFTQALTTGQKTSLEVYAKPEATNARMALNGLAQSLVSQLESDRVAALSLILIQGQNGGNSTDMQQTFSRIFGNQNSNSPSLIAFQAEDMGQLKPISASSYVVPGYLVMFVFFAAAVSAVEIIRERKNHTLERLLASSVTRESILGGIYLGTVFKGLVQIAIFWTMGILVFHVDMGYAPWAVLLISLLMVLMSAAFSVMLSTLARTDRSASAIATLSSLLLAPLGGCWWPLFITPHWMQVLAKFTPHGWANSGFNKLMLFGANGTAALPEMLALLGFAVAFLIIAVLNFRTEAEAG